MKKIIFILFLFLSISLSTSAAYIDSVYIYSQVMHKDIKTLVITPDSYENNKNYPVLYLLHGYSDNATQWAKRKNVKELTDKYGFIIVCPDGEYGSWYIDGPINKKMKYETFISSELISWIDKNYNTIPSRDARAITGLSMGGHGALFISFRHQDVFGAAGSMSGAVDLRPFPKSWNLKDILGDKNKYPNNWEKFSVINSINLLNPNSLKIIIDCGADDFFYDVNLQFHNKLLSKKIPHDFIIRPGEHNWNYWENSIEYQGLFFSNFFKSR